MLCVLVALFTNLWILNSYGPSTLNGQFCTWQSTTRVCSLLFIENYIILLPDKEVIVYSFDPKLIHQKPVLISSIKLNKEVRFVQVVKDSTFILCYADGIEVYSID
jgi:hypothetical protein